MAGRVCTECTSSRTDARSAPLTRPTRLVLFSPATRDVSEAAQDLEAEIRAKLAAGKLPSAKPGEGMGGEGHQPRARAASEDRTPIAA
jgi:hypothetical protein